MIESDLELVEKQAAAKAWLQRIENQGILEFASADAGQKVTSNGVNFSTSDFTLMYLRALSNYPWVNAGALFQTNIGATNSLKIVEYNSNISLDFYDGTSTLNRDTIVTSCPLPDDDMCIYAISVDRNGEAELSCFNLTDPNLLWGLIGAVDVSSNSAIDIGASPAIDESSAMQSSYAVGMLWLLPPVNRAMTSEEIHAYVNGIGSPNSLPEDLSGVGSLDYVLPIAANRSDSYGYDTFTNATTSGFDCTNLAEGSGTGGFVLSNPVDVGDTLFVSGTYSGDADDITIRLSDSSYGGVAASATLIQNGSFAVYLKNTDTESKASLSFAVTAGASGESYSISGIKAQYVGQIFSCRPHRDGIHTDDTGNGYNWTNVGSPVIKPFSAGIR